MLVACFYCEKTYFSSVLEFEVVFCALGITLAWSEVGPQFKERA